MYPVYNCIYIYPVYMYPVLQARHYIYIYISCSSGVPFKPQKRIYTESFQMNFVPINPISKVHSKRCGLNGAPEGKGTYLPNSAYIYIYIGVTCPSDVTKVVHVLHKIIYPRALIWDFFLNIRFGLRWITGN